jgi:hypothetical protein
LCDVLCVGEVPRLCSGRPSYARPEETGSVQRWRRSTKSPDPAHWWRVTAYPTLKHPPRLIGYARPPSLFPTVRNWCQPAGRERLECAPPRVANRRLQFSYLSAGAANPGEKRTPWCNGNTAPFGGVILGSSPSGVARLRNDLSPRCYDSKTLSKLVFYRTTHTREGTGQALSHFRLVGRLRQTPCRIGPV